MLALTVTADFADYKRGDHITDPEKIAAIKDSANVANVVQVVLPETPAPAPAS
jgi:hypothetical protein